MDFSVAAIRCFETTKVHHEKRWLRQQRLLCISTVEVLNCPFPPAGSQAHKLFQVFAPPLPTSGAASTSSSSPLSPPQPLPTSTGGGGSEPSTPSLPPKILEEKYANACQVLGKQNATLEDIKKVFNPSKVNRIDDITGVMLKGTDHLCINLKTDHPYFYNTPFAIDVSKILRSRFVAHSSAKLVEGNFFDEAEVLGGGGGGGGGARGDVRNISNSSGGGRDGNGQASSSSSSSSANENTKNLLAPLASSSSSPLGTNNNSSSKAKGNGGGGNNNSSGHNTTSSSSPLGGGGGGGGGGTSFVGYGRISDLFQAGVIELPSASDVDHLTPAALDLTRSLDWQGGNVPAAVLAETSAAVQKLAADAQSWTPQSASMPPSSSAVVVEQHQEQHQTKAAGGATTKSRSGGKSRSSGSHRSRHNANSILTIGTPTKCIEFRTRFNELRQFLVQNFLVSNSTRVTEVEKSLKEKLTFWRTTKKLPTFEDPSDAELVAELALQNLLFRSPDTFRNLWADISLAYNDEVERFRYNCELLSSPSVPFSYFGIPKDFETVRFDLVRHHLQSLSVCKTPSSMLNAIVSAIKSVIVCVKAKHVLSRRWTRACSLEPAAAATATATAGTATTAAAAASLEEGNPPAFSREPTPMSVIDLTSDPLEAASNNNNPSAAGAASSSSSSPVPASPVVSAPAAAPARTATTAASSSSLSPPTPNVASIMTMIPSSPNTANWTRDELDEISEEARKHSLYNTDDILPVFIYIVAYANIPQLVLYHRFLEQLGYDGEASERAFYVTVFFSAIQWLLDWKKPSKRKSGGGGGGGGAPEKDGAKKRTAATRTTSTGSSSAVVAADDEDAAAASAPGLSHNGEDDIDLNLSDELADGDDPLDDEGNDDTDDDDDDDMWWSNDEESTGGADKKKKDATASASSFSSTRGPFSKSFRN